MEENKEKMRKKKNDDYEVVNCIAFTFCTCIGCLVGIVVQRIAIGIGVHERFGLVGCMLGKFGIENKVGLWACDKD
ncbi:hypothetical protein DVH24_004760 [Malus domestica]|uniref:Uncharacterized protein n=1 Tax=Malus domestica TaxID=3750 RepID=A0A498IBK9_MALDO|nr:hypothetical protein DVH24_004760 [Malus domestica]